MTSRTVTVQTPTRRALLRDLVAALLLIATAFAAAPAVVAADLGKVNINTADAAELKLLPRVGPALAQRILTFREENGRFESVEDLILVRGIGDRTFDLLEPFVTIEGDSTLDRKIRQKDLDAMSGSSDGESHDAARGAR